MCITITEPHHNGMRIVEPQKGDNPWLRKLSVQEHYRLMGFADGEFNFGSFSYQQLCKRAGNGWDINVVSLLLKNIFSPELNNHFVQESTICQESKTPDHVL